MTETIKILNYLGFQKETQGNFIGYYTVPEELKSLFEDTVYHPSEMNFETDWNLLILLCQCCFESQKFNNFESEEHSKFHELFINVENWIFNNDIQSVYQACLEWIDFKLKINEI